ncbi:MAG: nucleotidyltransferase domain-containing protein [Candidatus Bathyarchaeia archaeon]
MTPLEEEFKRSRRWVLEALKAASKGLSDLLGGEYLGMILFGSWARGDAGGGSDVDVFVLLRSTGGLAVRSEIYDVLSRRLRRAVTLVDMRLNEIQGEDLELNPLLINLIADGVIIEDGQGILEAFIEEGRRLIEEMKLIRYKTPDGKYGWMRRDMKPITQLGSEV